MAVVRVCDKGSGIEENELSKILEAFTQLNGTCPPENDGLPIGLRLVKTTVELHGGSVVARSAGRGTAANSRCCCRCRTTRFLSSVSAPRSLQPESEFGRFKRKRPGRLLARKSDACVSLLLLWRIASMR